MKTAAEKPMHIGFCLTPQKFLLPCISLLLT